MELELGFHKFAGSGKKYAYVLDGVCPVFLRNIVFLQRTPGSLECVVVREWGARSNKRAWEPPKGQMEWKELEAAGYKRGDKISSKDLAKQMRAGALRELQEEAKIRPAEAKHLRMLPLAYVQAWPESGVRGAHFRYQFWIAEITYKTMFEAQARLQKICDHPELPALLTPDNVEKDAVAFWSPADGWDMIRGAFSQKMTRMFISFMEKHGI